MGYAAGAKQVVLTTIALLVVAEHTAARNGVTDPPQFTEPMFAIAIPVNGTGNGLSYWRNSSEGSGAGIGGWNKYR